jgi:hypothetical protein
MCCDDGVAVKPTKLEPFVCACTGGFGTGCLFSTRFHEYVTPQQEAACISELMEPLHADISLQTRTTFRVMISEWLERRTLMTVVSEASLVRDATAFGLPDVFHRAAAHTSHWDQVRTLMDWFKGTYRIVCTPLGPLPPPCCGLPQKFNFQSTPQSSLEYNSGVLTVNVFICEVCRRQTRCAVILDPLLILKKGIQDISAFQASILLAGLIAAIGYEVRIVVDPVRLQTCSWVEYTKPLPRQPNDGIVFLRHGERIRMEPDPTLQTGVWVSADPLTGRLDDRSSIISTRTLGSPEHAHLATGDPQSANATHFFSHTDPIYLIAVNTDSWIEEVSNLYPTPTALAPSTKIIPGPLHVVTFREKIKESNESHFRLLMNDRRLFIETLSRLRDAQALNQRRDQVLVLLQREGLEDVDEEAVGESRKLSEKVKKLLEDWSATSDLILRHTLDNDSIIPLWFGAPKVDTERCLIDNLLVAEPSSDGPLRVINAVTHCMGKWPPCFLAEVLRVVQRFFVAAVTQPNPQPVQEGEKTPEPIELGLRVLEKSAFFLGARRVLMEGLATSQQLKERQHPASYQEEVAPYIKQRTTQRILAANIAALSCLHTLAEKSLGSPFAVKSLTPSFDLLSEGLSGIQTVPPQTAHRARTSSTVIEPREDRQETELITAYLTTMKKLLETLVVASYEASSSDLDTLIVSAATCLVKFTALNLEPFCVELLIEVFNGLWMVESCQPMVSVLVLEGFSGLLDRIPTTAKERTALEECIALMMKFQ